MISRREKDFLTPHKVSVILFIERYDSLYPNYWGSESTNDTSTTHTPHFLTPKERKAVCILVAKLIQGSDLKLSEFQDLIATSGISSEHASIFSEGLHQLYKNGIESLLSLFDSVEKFCIQDQARSQKFPCLWTSLVGLHLRQLNLTFRKLGFSHVILLYEKFCNYYTKGFENSPSILEESHRIKKTLPSASHNETDELDVDMDVTSMDESDNNQEMTTPDHQNKSNQLRFSIPTNKKESGSTELTIGTRQQAELFVQEQITSLLQQEPSAMPPAQLQEVIFTILKTCPDLGKAHFLSYLNCLRVKEQTGAIHSLVKAYDSKLMHKDASRSDDFTRTFRYAALNMAALQAQFGHRELGLLSLEEAIRLAQESNDHVCLQYALAWLYSLSSSQKATLMKRSLTRSGELNLSYLSWLSLLNYTKELSSTTISPSELLKKLLSSNSQTNHNRSPSMLEGGLAGQSGLWGIQAGLWALWGNLPLTAICSQLVLRISNKTYGSIHAPSTANPICASLCNMALILANLGEYNLVGEILLHAQSRYPPPLEHSKLWMLTKCYVTFYEVLRQGLWSQANALAINMATIHPIYSKLLESELLVTKGEYSKALEVLGSLTKNGSEELTLELQILEPEMMVKILLIESEALAGGNNLGSALATLVKAIALAKDHHMAYLAALGNLQMASVQMHIGLTKEAMSSFHKGLDVILSGGGVYDQARAKLLQAKLFVRTATKKTSKIMLDQAAKILEEARKLFIKVNAHNREKECVYLKARFYHECSNIEQRNRSALEFKQLEQNHPGMPLVPNTCVF